MNLGLLEQVVAQHVIEPSPPRFVRIASDFYALDKGRFSRAHIFDVKIDVKDQVTHLLDGAPSDQICAGFLTVITLATVAGSKIGTVCDLPPKG